MNEAMQFVDSLAVRLKEPAEAVWAAYVRQAAIESGVTLLQYALLIAMIVFWVRVPAPKLIAKYKKSSYTDEVYAMGLALGSVALTILAIIAICTWGNTATKLFNPQFWAIQKLLGRI